MKGSKSFILSFGLVATMVSGVSYAVSSKFTQSDMNILANVANIDRFELLVSEVALNKSHDANVTGLAHTMVTQYSASLTQVLDMAQNSKLFVNALSHGSAQRLLLQENQDLAQLGALQGDQFDNVYVNALVSGHEGALRLIDTELMKTTKSKEIKQFLATTRAAVANRLKDAKVAQKKMGL